MQFQWFEINAQMFINNSIVISLWQNI